MEIRRESFEDGGQSPDYYRLTLNLARRRKLEALLSGSPRRYESIVGPSFLVNILTAIQVDVRERLGHPGGRFTQPAVHLGPRGDEHRGPVRVGRGLGEGRAGGRESVPGERGRGLAPGTRGRFAHRADRVGHVVDGPGGDGPGGGVGAEGWSPGPGGGQQEVALGNRDGRLRLARRAVLRPSGGA